MLEFWKKVKPYLPPGLGLARLPGDALGVGHGKTASGLHVGPTAGYIDQYAPPTSEPRRLPGLAEDDRPDGQGAAHAVRQEPWVIYADAPAEEKAAAKEFLKFFFKPENYRKYCDSVPSTSCRSSSPTSRIRAT
jgi:hypothetical protein